MQNLLRSLPEPFRERARLLNDLATPASGEYVLYWMRSAIRTDENPALEIAISCANHCGIPTFVYQGLSERYPYASDRHHRFILEGALDVQRTIKHRQIAHIFHLERRGHRGPHLTTLAARAAVVVTEDMPVEPLRSWTQALGHAVDTPIVLVDTACVVPMQLVGRAFERAFAFRKATSTLYDERLTQAISRVDLEVKSSQPDDLPFQPIDLQEADLAELVSQCDIDHAIGPVPHTVGGSAAGYERWRAFKERGLSRYSKTRNNALVDGVSRLSPYLHYGMVSPMRIARETAASDNEGAQKFLDELLIWRELAYTFCFHRSDHSQITALPGWALETLAEHEADERPALYSWEALARGRTGDTLWDAAQRSLLIQGELHNNVRMTWGKAILNWTRNAEDALAMMIDLNHRFALDGRDPASYGGILWCLGQFDRPFPPARPIFGTVRERSTAQHSKRLDSQAYLRKTTRPPNTPMPKVAVVGAGISGLICARTLADQGYPVTIFEKSRGVGGRMATRRAGDSLKFDHGAQYFTTRDPRFQRYVNSWIQDGVVSPWRGRIIVLENGSVQEAKSGTERFVAVPGMNAICRHLSAGLNIRSQTRVLPLERTRDHWQLRAEDDQDLGEFHITVVSAPPSQTAELLQDVSPLAELASETKMHGCWAVMLALPQSLGLGFAGAFVHNSSLAWIACNSAKPERGSRPETWVLHASPAWSQGHIEESPDSVANLLTDEFWRVTGVPSQKPEYANAHRWRFALPPEPHWESCLFDREARVVACGDWCAGPRVEGAFLSGMAAAGRVLGLLETRPPPARAEQLELF